MGVFAPSKSRGEETIHIAIMVDTQAILRDPNSLSSNVIFMTDDNGNGDPPSTYEGGDELKTHCNPGDQIFWKVFAINGNDTVQFTEFVSVEGNVFGNKPPSGSSSEYLATVVTTGDETYTVKILIAGAVPYTWDPHIISSDPIN
jgi:hypothetical protein